MLMIPFATICLVSLISFQQVNAAFPHFKGIKPYVVPEKDHLEQGNFSDISRTSSNFVQVTHYTDDQCHVPQLDQIFALNVCGPALSEGNYMKFTVITEANEKHDFLQMKLYSDVNCSIAITNEIEMKSALLLGDCAENTVLQLVEDKALQEHPLYSAKSGEVVFVGIYETEKSCGQSSHRNFQSHHRGLLQGNYFPKKQCIQGKENDFLLDGCFENDVFGTSFASSDGSCTGESNRFGLSANFTCDKSTDNISEKDFLGYSGFMQAKCFEAGL
jgi:hypothetical protein